MKLKIILFISSGEVLSFPPTRSVFHDCHLVASYFDSDVLHGWANHSLSSPWFLDSFALTMHFYLLPAKSTWCQKKETCFLVFHFCLSLCWAHWDFFLINDMVILGIPKFWLLPWLPYYNFRSRETKSEAPKSKGLQLKLVHELKLKSEHKH